MVTFRPNQFIAPITVAVPKEKQGYEINTEELSIEINNSRRSPNSLLFEQIEVEPELQYGDVPKAPRRKKVTVIQETK